MKQELIGPGGIKLILDSDQIFPDDPGQGTPAMVELGRAASTYWCALGEGTLLNFDCSEVQLTTSQSNWLEAQEDAVASFIDDNQPEDA